MTTNQQAMTELPISQSGFRTFTIIWVGQLVSLLGTGMSRFALLIWAYQQTGLATTLALLGFFSWVPLVIVSPLAGVVVDRWDRRKVMLLADLGAALMTGIVLLLLLTGRLAIWHLFVLEAVASICEAFQSPAYTAATTLLLPKEQYARAGGMRSMAQDAALIGAPLAGGTLLGLLGLAGVLWIDVATFFVAFGTLLWVRIPHPPSTEEEEGSQQGSLWRRMRAGFDFIYMRKGLLGLALLFTGINFFAILTYFSVLPALILARTGGNEYALAIVQGTLGGAGILGGLAVSAWGLPRRKIHAVLAGAAISFFGGDLLFAVGRSLPIWIIGATIAAFFIPFIVTANRTIWQLKVPPQMQGRVFAVQAMLGNLSAPVGYVLAGPLADRIFGPAMESGGSWSALFGWLVGSGPGAGIGLMFVCTAFLGSAMSLSGYLVPAIRRVETELPDFDALCENRVGEQNV
ncbi:MAG: MFS transporter [Caldilineaceae bacterium]|nr:MFS transporter [Caldilineaceae bacterium]